MACCAGSPRRKAPSRAGTTAAGGGSAQSAAFGSQTYWIRVCAVGVLSGTLDGVRFAIGANPTAAAASSLLPLNWVEIIRVNPGEKIAVLGNNAGTGTINITELE